MYILIYSLLLLSCFLKACSSAPQNNKKTEPKQQTTPPSPNQEHERKAVTLTQEQVNFLGVKIGKATPRSISGKIKTTGVIALPPTSKVTINALTPGRISLVYKVPGEYIIKGQVLATLQHPDIITLQEEYLKTSFQQQFLEQEWNRQKKLTDENVGFLKKFQNIEKEFQQNKTQLASLEARLNLLGIPLPQSNRIIDKLSVVAPISGFLSAIHVNNGAYVQLGAPLFELMDNSHMHLDLQVFEKDIEKIKIGQRVSFQLASQAGKTYFGRIVTIGKNIEAQTRAITVHAHFNVPPESSVLPGMYISGYIETEPETGNAVPETAVFSKEGKNYIFILQKKDKEHFTFLMTPVTLGEAEAGYVTIFWDKEQSAADMLNNIVLEGSYYLVSELQKDEAQNDSP
jgi:cobalt-zinc-cadmium efflux system membrane fusion protein